MYSEGTQLSAVQREVSTKILQNPGGRTVEQFRKRVGDNAGPDW